MGRADALGALEKTTAVEARGHGKIVEGLTKPRGAGPIQMLLEEALEYHRGAKIPLLMGFGEFWRALLRDSEDR
jgi:hypothetical protein